jgi:hypothetical protein
MCLNLITEVMMADPYFIQPNFPVPAVILYVDFHLPWVCHPDDYCSYNEEYGYGGPSIEIFYQRTSTFWKNFRIRKDGTQRPGRYINSVRTKVVRSWNYQPPCNSVYQGNPDAR